MVLGREWKTLEKQNQLTWDFPGGPVGKTLS